MTILWGVLWIFVVVGAGLLAGYVVLRRRMLGGGGGYKKMDGTHGGLDDQGEAWARVRTEDAAFDHDAHGGAVTWDRHSLAVGGRRGTLLVAGEFHYWRVPDRARWAPLLRGFRAAGLSAVRIYFHWGFHDSQNCEDVDGDDSRDVGNFKFNFMDNRDVAYLLRLCARYRLLVLAAPGPYICAETQAGGIPSWLVARRDVRIRHASDVAPAFARSFDPAYAAACARWFNAILPFFVHHQITNAPPPRDAKSNRDDRCVVALQIENESFERFFGLPVGLSDDMRFLAGVARAAGITLPLFTNDAWEEGSFVARNPNHRDALARTPTFGLDLYGFDKYVVFCPTSAPLATVSGSTGNGASSWPEWSPSSVIAAFDRTESAVRALGGGAAQSPILIPELQGGWFNHYTVAHTFDDVYDFYGERFTRTIVTTALAQGSTAFSLYMFYGGTNWGTIGDPDVYTSYDYSACIREFGHLSGRARTLRLALAFARSFATLFSHTDPHSHSLRCIGLDFSASLPNFIARRRRSAILPHSVDFVFFRNFTASKAVAATITISRPNRNPILLKCRVPYKDAFIGLGNYPLANGLHLLLATLPIHLRIRPQADSELWFIQSDHEFSGQLAFAGPVRVEGSLDPISYRDDDDVSIVTFKASSGWAKISPENASPNSKPLVVIALTGRDLYTLEPVFEDMYWRQRDARLDALPLQSTEDLPIAVFWGSYGAQFDPATRSLDIEQEDVDTAIYAIAADGVGPFAGFGKPEKDDHLADAPFIAKLTQKPAPALQAALAASTAIELTKVEIAPVDFNAMPWQPLETKPGSTTEPIKNSIDFAFTSGHTLYKLEFNLPSASPLPQKLAIDINMRHRCTVYINGVLISSHTTYSLGILRPGSKNGPDIGLWGGWESHALPAAHLRSGPNVIIVLTESFGLNRQPFTFNDVRSPRGILAARFGVAGKKGLFNLLGFNDPSTSDSKIAAATANASLKWSIAGVDVRTLPDAFNHSGIPGQDPGDGAKTPITLKPATAPDDAEFDADAGAHVLRAFASSPTWFRAQFRLPPAIAPSVYGPGDDGYASPDRLLRFPLRMHITGPATAYVFINGTFTARYYGNGDGPQRDFYVPEGLIKASNNTMRVLVYGQRAKPTSVKSTTPDREYISVALRPWMCRVGSGAPGDDRSLATSSGNIDDRGSGKPFVLYRSTLQV